MHVSRSSDNGPEVALVAAELAIEPSLTAYDETSGRGVLRYVQISVEQSTAKVPPGREVTLRESSSASFPDFGTPLRS